MNDTVLKRALYANAAFSTVSAIVIVLFVNDLSRLFANIDTLYLQLLSLGLILFAGFVAWVASRSPINVKEAKIITIADWSWVVGSGLLIALTFDVLSILAIDLILGVALAVACFAIAQGKGLKRLTEQKDDASFLTS